MIKTMIVDDDIEMLSWLGEIIDWKKYGFTITSFARNGAEALVLCREEMPDLIITDIAMPSMNGIELLNEVKKTNPHIKCIFLTCHENFNYALEAVKLQADDYIIKYTLTKNSLAGLLDRLRNSFKAADRKQKEVYLLERELSFNKPIIEEKLLVDIAENVLNRKEDILERASALKIKLPDGPFRVISTFVDNYEKSMKNCIIKENNLFKSSILNVANEILLINEGFKCFSFGTDKYVTLYWDGTLQASVKQKLIDRLNRFHSLVFENFNIRISSCISRVCMDYNEIPIALNGNIMLRDSYFYEGSGLVITEGKIYSDDDGSSLLDEFMADFIPALKEADKNIINRTLEWLYNRLNKRNYSPASAKRIFKNIKMELELAASKKGYGIENLTTNPDTFDVMKAILTDMVETYLVFSEKNKLITSRWEIDAVLKYIETNIHERITCEAMAEMVDMNYNYFSRLFKNETGISFSDYLTSKRIEKATMLLKYSSMRIEEITEAIGLEQPSYFYKLYRKVTGRTPGEIREEK